MCVCICVYVRITNVCMCIHSNVYHPIPIICSIWSWYSIFHQQSGLLRLETVAPWILPSITSINLSLSQHRNAAWKTLPGVAVHHVESFMLFIIMVH